MPKNKNINIIQKGRLISILLFVLLALILFFLLPKKHHLSYEYKKGRPWLHADLIAPFDFVIRKTPEEIQNTRDSIKNNFIPYYYKDNEIEQKVQHESEAQLEKIINNKTNENEDVLSFLQNMFLKQNKIFTSKIIQDIYKCGVISFSDSLQKEKTHLIKLISTDISEIVDISTKMYSPEQASAMMLEQLIKLNEQYFRIDSLHRNILVEFCNSFTFLPNIIYDEAVSSSVLNDEYKKISLTIGKVQKGEIIVQRGHIVNDNIYRSLFSLEEEYKDSYSNSKSIWLYSGYALLISLILIVYYLHLNFNFKHILLNAKLISFIIIQMIIMVGLSYLFTEIWDINIYLLPYGIFPILIYSFYNNRIALVSYWMLILLVSFFAPNSFDFILLQIVAGMIVLFSLRSIQKRLHLFMSVLFVLITYSLAYIGISFIKEGSHESLKLINFIWFLGNSFLLLTLFPLMYIYEKIFGFLSDITLIELSDTNNPALRDLSEQAPGTFQHSMQVANLAESVIRKIGGNPLLARTGALYHDIGKTIISEYFIENQHGFNIHSTLSYEESAKYIIGHVEKGVEVAKKHHIPAQIVDFIKTHHGTTITRYFYNSYINENPNKKINLKLFTYPGPKPTNVETAIVMMADAIEAAARSLKSYSEESITNLVNKIIDSQIEEQQFENVNITFKNIMEAKKIFISKLMNIYHTRIEYPEISKHSNE